MSNSSMVNYTKLSPHYNKRNKPISKITIHHMAGNLTVEGCGAVFQSKKASSNYGIGTDGRVGLYVEECNRSWASSNAENDHMAVTIEVANDEIGGNWHVSDTAYNKLIDLCVDICKRNGIKSLNFTGDKKGNLTMHKYFAATACPGSYLESHFPDIAKAVNARLQSSVADMTTEPAAVKNGNYLVRVTASALNIRKGAGTNYPITGCIRDKGVYTIVEEAAGEGATKWGKLKSGAGWIALDYTKRV